jgi:hypothetical protein
LFTSPFLCIIIDLNNNKGEINMDMIIKHDDRNLSEIAELKAAIALECILQNRILKCTCCRNDLSENPKIGLYDHSGGVRLVEQLPKMWVSLECSCGYHTSINKLGWKLWSVFKDDFDPKMSWRVQMPKGRMPFRLRREAEKFVEATKKYI